MSSILNFDFDSVRTPTLPKQPETFILDVYRGFKVYVERYWIDDSFETIILVNGALATTSSFNQTVKYLRPHFNIILYDLPYAGRSKGHSPNLAMLTKDDEVEILSSLIDRFKPEYLISMSWGGVAALLTLARRPPSIKKAVIGSFSPVLNEAMQDYLDKAQLYLGSRDHGSAARLLNETVGQHLPRLLKIYNGRYLLSLSEHEAEQIAFHIQQIIALDSENYVDRFSEIDIEVLFVNGKLDEHTTPKDVEQLSRYIRKGRFVTVPSAGHFLELENKYARAEVRDAIFAFLL